MSDQPRPSAASVEAYFDRTPQPFGDGPPDPVVYEALQQALRQRTVIIAAKRRVDVCYISGLDRATAERHLPLAAGGGGRRARVPARAGRARRTRHRAAP